MRQNQFETYKIKEDNLNDSRLSSIQGNNNKDASKMIEFLWIKYLEYLLV